APSVLVTNSRQLFADLSVDSEFLFQFAAERVTRLFAFFDFAAGELPLQRHRLMLGALTDQYLGVFEDQTGNYLFHDRRHGPTIIAEVLDVILRIVPDAFRPTRRSARLSCGLPRRKRL